ncbi:MULTISPECIES: O-methyltransferase [unclassified Moraxella]|uniref:O-methyltransferase n=1 Tax=unclassified Moraxella TaxID=2685852 RepID=UPI003AF713D7
MEINYKNFLTYTHTLYQTDKAYDDSQADRLARHRHLEPDSAEFLASFVISKNVKNVLEIGTSTGYSTLWIAYALHQINAQPQDPSASLTSIDIDEWRLLTARNHLRTLRLEDAVTLQQVDAKDFLHQSNERYDMIFLDAERKFYGEYVADLKRLMRFGDVLVVDNVVSHADEVVDFLAEFQQDDSYLCSTLPIGAGLFIAVKQNYTNPKI